MQSSILGRLCIYCIKILPKNCLTKVLLRCKLNEMAPTILSVRGRKTWLNPYYIQLYKRRLEAGPEPERHRSVWSNWDYNCELYAFAQRLGEQCNDDTLRQAFTHQSYIEKEGEKRAKLGMGDGATALSLDHNDSLADTGREFTSDYITLFLHHNYPYYPEEGISHIHDYLLGDDVTSFVACHFGMKDLMLCADFPPETATLSKTLFAVIGALLHDQGSEKAAAFVSDLLITQLIGNDINEMWPITNPMGLLVEILAKQGRPEPEPRLTRHTGDGTVMSVYFVGIYCNKQLIGEAPGETVPIAEEMAARDALKRIFGTEDHRRPLLLGKKRPDFGLQENDVSHNSSDVA